MMEWKKSEYGIAETLDLGYGFKITAKEDLGKKEVYELYVNSNRVKREFTSLLEAKNHGIKMAIRIIDEWSKKIDDAPFTGV